MGECHLPSMFICYFEDGLFGISGMNHFGDDDDDDDEERRETSSSFTMWWFSKRDHLTPKLTHSLAAV